MVHMPAVCDKRDGCKPNSYTNKRVFGFETTTIFAQIAKSSTLLVTASHIQQTMVSSAVGRGRLYMLLAL